MGVAQVKPYAGDLELVGAPGGWDNALSPGAFTRGYPLGDIGRRAHVLLLVSRLILVGFAVITTANAGNQASILFLLVLGTSWFLVLHISPALLPPGVALGAGARMIVRALAMALLSVLLIVLAPDTVVSDEQLIRAGVLLILCSIPLEIWRDARRTPMRVLIVGRHGGGAEVAEVLAASPREWSLIGLVDTPEESKSDDDSPTLHRLISEQQPHLVVLSDSPGRDQALGSLLTAKRPSFRIVSLDHFLEFACGRISVWRVSPLWFMSLLHGYRVPYRAATKRLMDLSMSLLLMLFTWPLLIVVAMLVRLSSPGPVLYRQMRVGEFGQPFEMLKFRTMKNGAETDGEEVWAAAEDARVTRAGRYLRRYRLDELPQLGNIVRGDMSFVGPRPERPGLADEVGGAVPHWSRRLMVRPGVTGWAQVRHGYTDSELGAADKLAFDLYYLKHQSLAFDLAIVLKTIGVVLRGFGSR